MNSEIGKKMGGKRWESCLYLLPPIFLPDKIPTAHPQRDVVFIHRLLQSDLKTTAKYFQPLIGPERWTDKDEGYRTLKDLSETEPQNGSDLADIKDSAKADLNGKKSALANAADIEQLAIEAQKLLATIKPGSNHELALNLRDIEAMTCLAQFSASKFRAAVLVEQNNIPSATEAMLAACCHWKKYADIMDELYVGVDMQRNYHFKSWHQLDADVLRDLTELGGPMAVDCDNPHPWARIVSPNDQSEMTEPIDLAVNVNAGDGDKKVDRVELRSNGELIKTATQGSFTFTIKGMKAGDYVLSARVFDQQGAVKEHDVSVAVFNCETKDTLPWKEAFTFPDQTAIDIGKTSWTAERTSGVFEVKDNALFANDKGNEGVFRTGEIDISGGLVELSLQVRSLGGVDNGDYVRFYKIVDGEAETLVGEIKGKQNDLTTLKGTAEGKRLTLVIRVKVSSDDEIYFMDNLKVLH